MKKNVSILAISMDSGGAEKTISLLLQKLIVDYNVHLVLFQDSFHFEVPETVKIKILNRRKKTSTLNKIFQFPQMILMYKKYIKENNIHIALSFLTRPNLINCITKSKKVKVIISERCFPSIAYKSNRARYLLYKTLIPILYNRANRLFSNSVHINNDLKKSFGLRIPMDVIYNPISIPRYLEINMDFKKKDFDLVWVGKLYNIKNPLLLVKALEHTELSVKTLVIGEGLYFETISKESDRLKITLTGKVKNVFSYLERCKVFILTSESEGFPNVILEGMSYGLPIISTNCKSGPLELLNENNPVTIPNGEFVVCKYGILVNVSDEHGLSKAIEHLLGNPELFTQLSEASMRRSQDFSTERIYQNLVNIIEG